MSEAGDSKPDFRRLPGPRPALGRFGATLQFFNDAIGYLDHLFARHGRLVGVPTMAMATTPRPDYPGTVYLHGADLIQEVSTQHERFHRVPMSLRLYPVGTVSPRQAPVRRIMTGLTQLNEDEYRRQRGMMMPAFRRQTVHDYHDAMVEVTDRLLAELRPGQQVDLCALMLDLMLRISTDTLFGHAGAGEGRQLTRMADRWMQFVMSPAHLFAFDLPGSPYRHWLDLSAEIERSTRRVIAEKRAAGADDGSLLDLLIQARDEQGSRLSEDALVGHVSLMLWGSRDASAYALVWTLLLLSQHPAVLADLVDELDGQLRGTAPSIEQLERLPFLDSVIRESLRLLPPFPLNHRVAGEDVEIGGQAIPAGAELVMSIYHTHRDPEIFAEPERFAPERWSAIEPSVYAFTPFGGGPRMCLGSSFANQEMGIALAMLLQRFRFEPIPGTRVDRIVRVALMPRQGIPMILRSQDRDFATGTGALRGNLCQMVAFPS